jgi:hypothetical protein
LLKYFREILFDGTFYDLLGALAILPGFLFVLSVIITAVQNNSIFLTSPTSNKSFGAGFDRSPNQVPSLSRHLLSN